MDEEAERCLGYPIQSEDKPIKQMVFYEYIAESFDENSGQSKDKSIEQDRRRRQRTFSLKCNALVPLVLQNTRLWMALSVSLLLCVSAMFAALLHKGRKTSGSLPELTCNTTNDTEHMRMHQLLKNVICINHDPRTYIVHHLNGNSINIDGNMDDPAWKSVNWTDYFTDILGEGYQPSFKARLKLRWDDAYLYILAWMEEASVLEKSHDQGPMPNILQVMFDTDHTMHNFKDIQVDTNNVTLDRMFLKSPLDSETPIIDFAVAPTWNSASMVASGFERNDSSVSFWIIEMAVPFTSLVKQTTNLYSTPADGNVWFFNAARTRNVSNSGNRQTLKDDQEWLSWQPMYASTMHIPSRFGYVQFRKQHSDKFQFDDRVYTSLFEIYESQKRYKTVNGMFATNVTKLDIEKAQCLQDNISAFIQSANQTHFEARVQISETGQTGRIRQDRRVMV